jgi:hypothetical protein
MTHHLFFTHCYRRLFTYILGKSDANPLTAEPHPSKACTEYETVKEYIIDAVGEEAYEFLLAEIPEPFNYEMPLDVCLWLEAEAFLGRTMDTSLQLIPPGGWHIITEKARAAAAARGVRFFAGNGIDCISNVRDAGMPIAATSRQASDDADDSDETEAVLDVEETSDAREAPSGDDDAAVDEATTNLALASAPVYKYAASGFTSGRVFVAERVIFASGPLDVRKLGGDVGQKLAVAPAVKFTVGIEVAVYNAFYPSRWWEQYCELKFTNMPVRYNDDTCLVFSEFLGHPYFQVTNGTRPVYAADIECAAFYRNLSEFGGLPAVRQHVQDSLERVYPLADVPEPYYDAFKYHPDGWHSYDVGATQNNLTVRSVLDWSLAPLVAGTDLCKVGEAWDGNLHRWTVGAWDTAWRCVVHNYKDLLTPQGLAAAVYINSG